MGDEDGMDQEEAMTSFCAEEQDMDDIGAAGLLSEIENALGMGFGTLGTTMHFFFIYLNTKAVLFKLTRLACSTTQTACLSEAQMSIMVLFCFSRAENKVVCLSSPICGLLARLSVRSVLIRSANTIARVETEAV